MTHIPPQCPQGQPPLAQVGGFCRNCGKNVARQAVVCIGCGCAPQNGVNFCPSCGAATTAVQAVCLKCGTSLAPVPVKGSKSKMAAGLLGIFLGGFGVHRFYLGFIGIGIAQIAVTLITCGAGALWGFIEGILILTGSMNRDAQGMPLAD